MGISEFVSQSVVANEELGSGDFGYPKSNTIHCNECGICSYSSPVCSKSICDLSNLWRKIDQEVASTPMPDIYKDKMKCLRCKSYNTRQIQHGSSSSSGNRIAEMVR